MVLTALWVRPCAFQIPELISLTVPEMVRFTHCPYGLPKTSYLKQNFDSVAANCANLPYSARGAGSLLAELATTPNADSGHHGGAGSEIASRRFSETEVVNDPINKMVRPAALSFIPPPPLRCTVHHGYFDYNASEDGQSNRKRRPHQNHQRG